MRLAEALVMRADCQRRVAQIKQERYSRQEVKFYTTIEIADLQKELDELSRQYRELDFKIQEKNWSTDFPE